MAPKNKKKRFFPKLKIRNPLKGIFKSCRDTSGVQVPGAATPVEAVTSAAPTTQATIQTTGTDTNHVAQPAAATPDPAPVDNPEPPTPAATTPTRADFDVTPETKLSNKLLRLLVIAFATFAFLYNKFKVNNETRLINTSDALALIEPVTPVESRENCVFVPARNYALCNELNTTSPSVELPVNNSVTSSASNMQVCGYKSYLPAFARRSALIDYTQQVASVNVTEEAPKPTSNPFAPLFMSFTQDVESTAIATSETIAHVTAQDHDAQLRAAIEAYALRGR